MNADQVYDGEPFEIEGAKLKIACCHCGLVHDIKIVRRPKKRGYRLTVWQNLRSTGQIRRWMKYKGIKNVRL
jgi:hypothetical protein